MESCCIGSYPRADPYVRQRSCNALPSSQVIALMHQISTTTEIDSLKGGSLESGKAVERGKSLYRTPQSNDDQSG